ncbi:winged helix-turn-helix domain-containing protein [Haloarchaeobius sp. DT45]|uniref:winged helix-turn-helix domain-containing protein n=1 Tax=Haloarchaeobius sp. DT45 TaxID=3446116 RepID=UPI003F6AC5BC
MEDAATRPPEEAFGLVANETRIAILRALWEADEQVLSFSELRDRVGIRDTGQFNYHLGKLVGTFVEKVDTIDCDDDELPGDSDGGYTLRFSGIALLGSVLSGVYTHESTVGPVPVEESCMACEGSLEAVYEDQVASLRCTDCEQRYNMLPLPPAVVEGRDPAALPDIINRYLYTVVAQVSVGFCPICSGQMAHRAAEQDDGWHAISACQRCGLDVNTFVPGFLIGTPAVVGFFDDHGIDVRQTSALDIDAFHPENGRAVSEDPLRIEVTFELDEETLVVTVDESLAVVETRRE